MILEYQGPVWSRAVDRHSVRLLRGLLRYPTQFVRRDARGRKVVRRGFAHCVDYKTGAFLSGFWHRAVAFAHEQGPGSDIGGVNLYGTEISRLTELRQGGPSLPKVEFRDYQLSAIDVVTREHRGVIRAPTGAGKTMIAMGLVSCYPRTRVLFVVDPTTGRSLLWQTYAAFRKAFPDELMGIVGDSQNEIGRITIATINSLHRMAQREDGFPFADVDILIVDECHSVSSLDGMYWQVLTRINAPMRLGMTGTLPVEPEARMALEGLIGPVIVDIKDDPMEEQEIIAPVTVRLVPLERREWVGDIRSYREQYQRGVVESRGRNVAVLEQVRKLVSEGRTVLVFVTRVEHGQALEAIAGRRFPGLRLRFVQGSTEGQVRDGVRKALDSGGVDVAVTTTVWKQGVDIPNLGAIVNAAGGKSEIQTLQVIGRGRRMTEAKRELVLVDFVDPSSRYFADHFVARLVLYLERGWRIES